MKTRYLIIPTLCLAMLALSGCSSGGKSGVEVAAIKAASTVLGGMASKGPVMGGTVHAFGVVAGAPDRTAPIGQAQTDGSGNYSIELGPYEGPVLVEVEGGTFIDEVSGATVTLKTPLHALIPSVPGGSTIAAAVTPLTELAYRKVMGGGPLTSASIAKANVGIGSLFGLADIVSTLPDPAGADDNQKKYVAACIVFSQLVNDNRNGAELLDDALARILIHMGDEVEHNGGLSLDSIVQINSAIAHLKDIVPPGSAIIPIPTPSSGLLKMSTTGTPGVIAGIDMTIALPPGVIVNADPMTGEVTAEAVTISGAADVGTNGMVAAKYTPASIGTSAQLHIVIVNSTGFTTGEFVTIPFDLTTGAIFPATSAFTVATFSAKALDGSLLAGVTAAPSSVAGL